MRYCEAAAYWGRGFFHFFGSLEKIFLHLALGEMNKNFLLPTETIGHVENIINTNLKYTSMKDIAKPIAIALNVALCVVFFSLFMVTLIDYELPKSDQLRIISFFAALFFGLNTYTFALLQQK